LNAHAREFDPASHESDGSDETNRLAGYQSPSALAVGSLIVGLLSPVYVLGSLLVFVPIAGIALSLLAVRRIAGSDGALVGRSLAVLGLALPITSAAAVVSYSLVTRQIRSAQAAEVGREWLNLVISGDTASAYELTSNTPPPDPKQSQEFGVQGNPYERYLEGKAVQSLRSLGGKPEIRDDGVVLYAAAGGGEFYVRRRYTVIPDRTAASDDRGAKSISVLLQMHRTSVPGMRGMTWQAKPLDEERPAI
jgi:hypothetical protein